MEKRSEEDEEREEDSNNGGREKRTSTEKSGKTQGEGEESLQAEAVKWLLCVDLNLEMWKNGANLKPFCEKFKKIALF